MDESDGESGGSSPEHWANKRLKLEDEEDRISALPDSIIQHILSFLPSTKQAIQTRVLSKRWLNQWSRVPLLIFHSSGKNDPNFSHFIDRTLTMHDCSKLKKFEIKCDRDTQLSSKIGFAMRKHAEELVLHLSYIDDALVRLELFRCYFDNQWRPNWPSLKELKLECSYLCGRDRGIESVVSGCPILQSLELNHAYVRRNDAIASKSLKRLVLIDAVCNHHRIEISCPNLEELCIIISANSNIGHSVLSDGMIENVLSSCPFLHTLKLLDVFSSERLVITSKSLKKLVLGELGQTSDIEILCPNLEESNLLAFSTGSRSLDGLEMKMLKQLQRVKVLEIGSAFIKKLLDTLEVGGQFPLLFNCKWLTLSGTYFDDLLPGIECAIHSSPMLEELVIKFQLHECVIRDLSDQRKNYRNLNKATFSSVSNLKTVKLVGLSKNNNKQNLVFDFIESLLENSPALENIVIILAKCRPAFMLEVSKKLLGFQKCYPHTTVELRST